MFRQFEKTYTLQRLQEVTGSGYGTTRAYTDIGTISATILPISGTTTLNNNVLAANSTYYGLTSSKDVKANDRLVNGADKYDVTFIIIETPLTQIYLRKSQ